MKRVIFVDDEQRVLDGLRNLMRLKRREWSMRFAEGADAALEMLEQEGADVVVTDMRMPGKDGAQLLWEVRERYPETIRIVLSGYTELEAALRALPVAHQFLQKPCDPVRLIGTVTRALEMSDLLRDDKLRSIVTGLTKLPSRPRVYQHLIALAGGRDSTIEDFVRAIESDLAISVKVLQISNSAYFNHGHNISNLRDALTYLGPGMVKNLVLTAGIFDGSQDSELLEQTRRHGLLVGSTAARLVPRGAPADDAFIAGLLHGIGGYVLSVNGRGPEIDEAMGHARVGAYLLGIWGLPSQIVEAVLKHHGPIAPLVPGAEIGVLEAVHAADVLAHRISPIPEDEAPGTQTLEIADPATIAQWRGILKDQAQQLDAEYVSEGAIAAHLPASSAQLVLR